MLLIKQQIKQTQKKTSDPGTPNTTNISPIEINPQTREQEASGHTPEEKLGPTNGLAKSLRGLNCR